LVAVPEGEGPSSAPERRPPRRTTGLLVLVALACAAGWGLAQHRSGQLLRELSVMQGELSEARADLAALEAQRSEVRSQLEALSADATALSGRLAELEALVASDHPGASHAQPLRSESATGE
jgi:type IV secretory pathway VirJ component